MFGRIARFVQQFALALALLLLVVLALQNRRLRTDASDLRKRVALPYPGFVVPTFRAATLAGDSVTLGRADSGGRQVIFVFNTTCGFCLATLPS